MPHIYLADPTMRVEQLQAIRAHLPVGWTLEHTVAGAAAILTENVPVTEELMTEAGPSLRLIAKLDTGKATVAPTQLPVIELINTALAGVAEHTVTLILALSHHLLWVAQQTAQQHWIAGRDQPVFTDQQKYTYNWIGLEDFGTIYRQTVGLVGLGHIGRATAARLRPFGVKLLYTQRHRLPQADEARLGVQWRELDDLLRESDFVSLHHRFQEGEDGNDQQFSAREFALMKPNAYFVNTARGRMVDEVALVAALRDGTIAGAGLDVFRYEPLPADHPLLALAGPNVILTAHVGGGPLTEAWHSIGQELADYLREFAA